VKKELCFVNPRAAFKDGGYIGEVTTYSSGDSDRRGIRIDIPMGSHSLDAIEEVANWLAGKSWRSKS